jgi:hypothetical protein
MGLKEFSNSLDQFSQMVETTIDLAELDRHNFVIKAEFDDSLQAIKDELETVRDGLDEEHANVARDLDMELDQKVLHFEQHTLYGYCFRLTKKVRHPPLDCGVVLMWGGVGGISDQEQVQVHRVDEQVERHLLHDQGAQGSQ